MKSFVEVARASINTVEEDIWQEIEMAVDSGATETVVGTDMLTHIATTEADACKRGVQYASSSTTSARRSSQDTVKEDTNEV